MGLKERLIIAVFGAIFCVPTSIFGYQLMGFKVLKQEVDCITDVNDAMHNLLSSAELNSGSRELDNINNNLRTCVKGIDPRKGNLEFAVEQYKRHH
ncbi:MAG: hypothetical protein RSE65_21900 [Hafnia sp.]